MSDEGEQLKTGRTGMWWAPGLAGALVIYVLSIGPVAVLMEKFGWSYDGFAVIYAPLGWLGDHWSPAGEFFRAYVGLWFRMFGMGFR